MVRSLRLAAMLPLWFLAGDRPAPQGDPPLLGGAAAHARPVIRYVLDAELKPETKDVEGTVHLRLRNTSLRPLREARLHLYLNAFSGQDTLFMRETGGRLRLSRFDPSSPGRIRVLRLRQGPKSVGWRAIEDGTVAVVALQRPVSPGDDLDLDITFSSRLPRVFARTGYADDFFMVAQWYPKPGVLRPDGSWHCPPLHGQSEFFADFASYEVTLRVPRGYRVAATGSLDTRAERGPLQILRYRAEMVHDFAFAAWPHFTEESGRVGSVTVRYLGVPGRGQAARQMALVRAGLGRLGRWFGAYPYPELTVVDVPTLGLGAGGMEYPTLFTTWMPWWTPGGLRILDETTVHELVHQWFQGVVANNEAEEPWLDEGLTSYVSGLLLDEIFGRDASFLELGPVRMGHRDKERARIAGADLRPLPVAWPARRFPSHARYVEAVYVRAALLLVTLESLIGREAMIAALGDYVRSNAFRHPETPDLEQALLARTPHGMQPAVRRLLDGVLRGGEPLDYDLRCAEEEVTVERRGTLAVPLELKLGLVGGAERSVPLDGVSASTVIRVPGLRRASLGPPGRLALDTTPLDGACDLHPGLDRPATRWAAMAQRILQVVGP
jgi:hypothetical protein